MAVVTPFDPWRGPLCTCPPKYSFSPYTGCGHACTYCYITAYVPRAFQPRPKKDIVGRLLRDLRRTDPGLHISVANSSDPYTPPEDRLRLTRGALRALLGAGFRVQLVTKSDLVLRDLDLIRRGNCSVSVSVTMLDDALAGRLEPNAPPPSRRLEAVGRLVRGGVPCSVRVDPVIPGISDAGLEGLVEAVARTGAGHVVASTYKAKPDSFRRVTAAFPALREKLSELYWGEGKRVQRAQYAPEETRREILLQLKGMVEERGMTYAVCREGLPGLRSGETCDGSHLIPVRRETAARTDRL